MRRLFYWKNLKHFVELTAIGIWGAYIGWQLRDLENFTSVLAMSAIMIFCAFVGYAVVVLIETRD